MGIYRYGRDIQRLDDDRYRLDRPLGSGGMADVWLAWDEQYERQVAIKVIRPEVLDQKTLNRFMKEANQLAQWHHQHILRVYDSKLELLDASRASVIPYIVMEYVEGGDLKQRLRIGQPYPFEETIRLFAELCSAVQYAHDHGIIHRDLKPANILFRRLSNGSEQAVLSDFGLAVEVDASQLSLPQAGTPAYMAPEQREGHVEQASDIYSLGVILYQLCTGWLPFQKDGRLPGELNPELPERLDKVILKALAKEPTKRYANASLFWQAVRASIEPAKDNSLAAEEQKKDTRTAGLLSDGAGSPSIPVHHNISWNRFMTIGLILLCLLLVFSLTTNAMPGILGYFSMIVSGGPLASTTTVTTTLATKTIQHTYVITAITGTPDASHRQVQARILSANLSQSQTVVATGVKQTPGAHATGTLTFYNGSTSPFSIAAYTVLYASGGIQIENTVAANIPAGSPSVGYGRVSVPAQAVNIGASGNIPAGAINGKCCASGNFITVTNLSPFTGGQDPQNYTFLQQSDVDGVATPLKQQLTASAQANINGQKHSGEQFINASNPISCTPTVTANPPVGSKTTSATVTVQVSCSGEVYNQQAALALAANLYKSDSTINPGSGFVLTGPVSTSLKVVRVDNKGTISLQVEAKGTWIYRSSKLVVQEKS